METTATFALNFRTAAIQKSNEKQSHAAFRAVNYPLLAGANENVLMRRLLEDPALRAAYVSAVTGAMAVAQADQWLETELTRQYALIRDAGRADTLKLATNDEFEQAFATLIGFARARPAFVLKELAALR